MRLRVDVPSDPLEGALLRRGFQHLQERADALQAQLVVEHSRAEAAIAETAALEASLKSLLEASVAVTATYGASQLEAERLYQASTEILDGLACQSHVAAFDSECQVCSSLLRLREQLQSFKSVFKDFQD